MQDVKIFHIADVHLCAPFSSLSPREADSARTSLRSAFAAAVLAAKNRGAQLFFIAGDLFDGAYVTAETKEFVCEKIAEYPECRFFIAPGNHDPNGEGSHYRRMKLPENVYVFGGRERVCLDELGVDVYGYGFGDRYESESPVTGYPPLDPDKINILVCHGDVCAGMSDYGPITKAEIGQSGFDYIALGHIHTFGGVLCENGVHYAYSGCIEGRGFDETGDKGGLFGTVSKGKAELGFVPLARRKYQAIEVDLTGVEERITALERIRTALKPYGGDSRVRVTLTGSPENVFTVISDGLDGGGSAPVTVEIIDKTVPTPKLTDIEKENTLRGVFCRHMQERLAALPQGGEEYAVCLRALKLGLAALDGRDISGV